MRIDGRLPNQIRPVRIQPEFIPHAEGSVLIEIGRTRVICTASVEERVPVFLKGSSKGWITSEYSMIPRSTQTRTPREVNRGFPSGRTQEIQRLIGRSLRTSVSLDLLGERTIWVDCDVIEADGGTRTAAITGAFVAVARALNRLHGSGTLARNPLRSHVAAVSVGIIGGTPMLDLNYSEDSNAEVDFNVVMTDREEFVEIQGTAERDPFGRHALEQLLDFARGGIRELIALQRSALQ